MPSQLYLIVPALPADHAAPLIGAVLQAAPFSSVRFSAGAIASFGEGVLKPLILRVQDMGAAALIEDDAALAARLGADGVHLTAPDEDGAAILAARALLPSGIVGAEAGLSRHLAMINGEKSADYISFSREVAMDHEIGSIEDMVQWWSELFELPCVALARHAETVEHLSQAGADFIAVDGAVWQAGTGAAAAAERLARQLELTS